MNMDNAEHAMATELNALAYLCHGRALQSGFYDDHKALLAYIDNLRGGADVSVKVAEVLCAEAEVTAVLARHALIVSEVSEMTEAVRKPSQSHHIGPEFTQEEEELADVLIRCFDYAGWRGLSLGKAVVAKMKYNATRPHKHGKLA